MHLLLFRFCPLRHNARVFARLILIMGCFLPAGCAATMSSDKAPTAVWELLAEGSQQDLIVVFEDSEIQAQASKMNKSKGIMFDDNDTIMFKVERYAAIKRDAISMIPSEQIEILKDYDALPLMLLRFRSTAALKLLLAYKSVVRVYKDPKESSMRRQSRP